VHRVISLNGDKLRKSLQTILSCSVSNKTMNKFTIAIRVENRPLMII
jgi:hypothetical protein